MRIDSHQHFWRYNKEEFGWICEGMEMIMKDQLPGHLSVELNKSEFDGSIAVQARQSLAETDWLLKLADQYDFIKGVVGWVDLRSPALEKQLEKYSKHPNFVGVRHVIQDEIADDFILEKKFTEGINLLKKFGLVYDILVLPRHLPNTIRFVEQFPDQTFVLDHMAKPYIRDRKLSPWKQDILQLAKFPNVYCKASGMVTENNWQRWKPDDFTPYLDTVFQAFGAERMMIGSDWPVCRVVGEYPVIMNIVKDYLKNFTESEKVKVLGGNAVKVYKLKS